MNKVQSFVTKTAQAAGVTALSFAMTAQRAFAQNTNLGNVRGNYSNTLPVSVGGDLTAPNVPVSQGTGNGATNIDSAVDLLDRVINAAFILLSGVLFVLFLYDLVKLFTTGEAEWGKKALRAFLILFIAVAVWGLVAWLSSTLDVGVGGKGVRTTI